LNSTSSLRISITARLSEKTLRLWKFGFGESAFPLRHESHVDVIVHVFHVFAKDCIIHQFV